MRNLIRYWSISTTLAFIMFFILSLIIEINVFLWDIFVALAMGSLIIILMKIFKEEKSS